MERYNLNVETQEQLDTLVATFPNQNLWKMFKNLDSFDDKFSKYDYQILKFASKCKGGVASFLCKAAFKLSLNCIGFIFRRYPIYKIGRESFDHYVLSCLLAHIERTQSKTNPLFKPLIDSILSAPTHFFENIPPFILKPFLSNYQLYCLFEYHDEDVFAFGSSFKPIPLSDAGYYKSTPENIIAEIHNVLDIIGVKSGEKSPHASYYIHNDIADDIKSKINDTLSLESQRILKLMENLSNKWISNHIYISYFKRDLNITSISILVDGNEYICMSYNDDFKYFLSEQILIDKLLQIEYGFDRPNKIVSLDYD